MRSCSISLLVIEHLLSSLGMGKYSCIYSWGFFVWLVFVCSFFVKDILKVREAEKAKLRELRNSPSLQLRVYLGTEGTGWDLRREVPFRNHC